MNIKIGLFATACLMVGASLGATIDWTGGAAGNWETDAGWGDGTGSAPTSFTQDYEVRVNNNDVVTLNSDADVYRTYFGNSGNATSVSTVLLTGGILHSGINASGVTNNTTYIGRNYTASMTVSAGATFIAERRLIMGRSGDGTSGTGIATPSSLNISGSVFITQNGDIDFGNDNASRNTGGGLVTINDGGLLDIGRLDFQYNTVTAFDSYVQINEGGTLILNGNINVQTTYIDAGTIKGTDLSYSYDSETNKTTVIPEPATLGLVAAFGAGMLFFRRRFMI